MTQQPSFEISLYDYVGETPDLAPTLRGVEVGAPISKRGLEAANDYLSDAAIFLQDHIDLPIGQDHILFQRDAYRPQNENVRDHLIHRLGQVAGLDIDGILTEQEFEAAITISESDRAALGVDSYSFDSEPTNAIVRKMQFKTRDSDKLWELEEMEFHHPEVRLLCSDIEMVGRYGQPAIRGYEWVPITVPADSPLVEQAERRRQEDQAKNTLHVELVEATTAGEDSSDSEVSLFSQRPRPERRASHTRIIVLRQLEQPVEIEEVPMTTTTTTSPYTAVSTTLPSTK